MVVRVVVVGAGVMGLNHQRVLTQTAGARMVGLVEPDAQRGNEAAARFAIPRFGSFQDALDQSAFDATVVAAPTVAHHRIGLESLRSGHHTFIEKPLAATVDEARDLVQASAAAKKVLAVGHIERFNPAFTFAKRVIDERGEGRILSLTAKRVSAFPGRIQDVGVITDLASHEIDTICALKASPIVSVQAKATGSSAKTKHENNAFVTLEMEDGSLGSIEANWISPIKVRRLEVITESHMVEVDYLAQKVRKVQSRFTNLDVTNLFDATVEFDTQEFSLRRTEPLALEHLDFLRAITTGDRPTVSGQDGLRVVELIGAALQSARTGTAVGGRW